MQILFLFLCLALVSSSHARPNNNIFNEQRATCGYESCHPTTPGVLNVHLVPHTHDDVGWLKTLDQYYYGSRTSIQRAGVQYILDSVVDGLLQDPIRRFVYAESAFFEKWWLEQNDERRDSVKKLVSEGRLEFAGGAWSMNDEAAVHYQSVIDQLTWGLRMLNDTFGECARPRAGWQIDPFGHGRELSSLWAQAGFDGLFFARIDHQDRRKRREDKELEMIWRGSDDLGASSDLLAGVLYSHYSPPPGFCFDILCSDTPIIDDPDSPDYNVDEMVEKFVSYVENQASTYKTNNVIITMGDDFFYQDANIWYKNLDKLIKYVNNQQNNVKLLYSTPSCYLKSLYDSNTTWPTKQDDFFPYGSDPHAFWTGYFTSRPTLKYNERRGNNLLQVCKQLQALTDSSDENGLRSLRGAMGVMQHHDAITGTEKQHVAQDYARILEKGIQDCVKVGDKAINSLMMTSSNLPMELCQLNMTECDISEKQNAFVLTVYNPTGREIDDYVRFPILINETYTIRDNTGNLVNNYVIPISENVREQLPRKPDATLEIVFKAEAIPAVGYKSYYINKGALDQNNLVNPNSVSFKKQTPYDDEVLIQNEFIQVSFDSDTGLMSKISLTENSEMLEIPVKQEFLYYEGWSGNNNGQENRASGAYVFRPKTTDALPIVNRASITGIYKNPFVEEVHQQFSSWVSQIIRVYSGQKHVELEWLVGPIPIENDSGKEIISRITTNFNTDGTFFTDSNGRQLLKRIRNKRPTWDIELEEPVSGNYYPVTSMITIKDEASKNELAFLTDRAQGGTSLKDGQIELMVHRRLLHDDAFGVGEALNETVDGVGVVARGNHFIMIGKSDAPTPAIVRNRQLALQKLLSPTVFFSPATNVPYNQWINNKNTFEGITGLPENIHLLTLEPWSSGSLLLRLEHYLQNSDDPNNLSRPASVNLETLLNGITINSVREVTLAANQWKNEARRLHWNFENTMQSNFNDVYNSNCLLDKKATNSCFAKSELLFTHKRSSHFENHDKYNVKDIIISLDPMEIKTFIIEI